MRYDIYKDIGEPKLNQTTRVFTGLGNVITRPKGTFQLKLTVGNDTYEIAIYVVSTNSMTAELILGYNFLRNTEIIIRKGQIEIKQLPEGKVDTASEKLTCNKKKDPECIILEEAIVADCATINEIEAPEMYRSKIEALVANYQPKKTVKTTIETKILLMDTTPVYLRPRRLAPKEKDVLNNQIREWLATGIIKPSTSEYASPVVIVRKKDGSSRVCIDYRALNKKMIRDKYPMPLIDDKIDALVNFRIFSVLDLKNGFFHVPVKKESQKYTAFVTPTG